jgi:hypothetical protein
VTGLSGVSASELPIFNAASPLGTLQEFASDVAPGISIDGDGSSDNSLSYRRGASVSIALKNADAEPGHLHWSFQIDNQIQSSGDLDMPPRGSAPIPITPSDASFSFFDRIQPSQKTGILLLSLVVPGVPAGLLPVRPLSVWLVMPIRVLIRSCSWDRSSPFFCMLGRSELPRKESMPLIRSRSTTCK